LVNQRRWQGTTLLKRLQQSPRALGYRWPAEWEPQQSVWLGCPHDASLWPIDLEPIWDVFADLIAELAAVQRVDLLVQNADVKAQAEARLLEGRKRRRTNESDVVFHFIPTDDSWLRDTGPIFLNRNADGRVEQAAVGFDFNGWGKFQPFETDAKVAERIAMVTQTPLHQRRVIFEGGAIDGNGAGAVLTTESCLLNENRNAAMTKSDYEDLLRECLNTNQLIWLAGGLYNDHTDGHVDVVSRFVGPTTVVSMWADDRNDPSRAMLEENERRLKAVKIDGDPLRIVHLPMPGPVEFAGKRLAAGYANFVLANELIIVPTYNCDADTSASKILEGLFPDRRVVGLCADELLKGGGAFHCLTQQQPAVE
jgi:agmatine deiminase